MSSTRFVAVLKPERRLRGLVILAGCAALLIGITLLIRLPIAPLARLGLVLLWLVSSVWEIGRLSRGAGRVREIRLSTGSATVVNRQGREDPVQIISGSVVLPRVAWLRLRLPDGLICGELLRGDPRTNQQWRHLQILWRHGSGAFGRAAEADTISNRKTGSHS